MKIYLAGIATRPSLFYDNKDIQNYLESFYYISKIDISRLDTNKLLVDSGAFTFMASKPKNIDWDKYTEKYADFINGNDIKLFFELDIDSIVGLSEVNRLRNKLESLTNKKSIPVWHRSRGLDYWIDLCKTYDYIAIGGIVSKEIKRTEYPILTTLLKIAKQHNCKVHGLGFTGTKLLKKYKFYSVDSTSWITSRFNAYSLFNPSTGVIERHTKNKANGNKLRVKKESAEDYDLMQIKEWIKFQEYAKYNL